MTKQEAINLLLERFDDSFLLSRSQTAKVVNKSVATIDRWKTKGLHLDYKKTGTAPNSPVEYPIDTVANYIVNNNIKSV